MAITSRKWYNVSEQNKHNIRNQEGRHMSSIAEKAYAEQSSIKSVSRFFKRHQVGSVLRNAGAYKQKGFCVVVIVMYLVSLVYTGKGMIQDMNSSSPLAQGFSKDTVYRFLNQLYVNWQSILLLIAGNAVSGIDKLTSEARLSAYVIDDTTYEILYAKRTELVSKIYDHAEKGKNRFKWGFRMLVLGWTDGVSFIPLAFRHLASSDLAKQRCGANPAIDKRSRAYRIRKEAVSKATDVLLAQLNAAIKVGIAAKYVLFDTWFAYPTTIIKIRELGLHVVARVKNTTKIKYMVDGEKKTAKQIFGENKKRRGKSRYLLSVNISLYTVENEITALIPAKIVYVRNRQKRNEWIALISTDLELSEDEIITLYGKRWDIEVFFKICKSYLKLAKEFQQLSYDAITAHTSIVMLRYIILSEEKRTMEDPRTLGELFYMGFDEAADIKFEQALILLMSLLSYTLKDEDLGLTEEQMSRIMDSFINRLPEYLKICLQPTLAA
jgi:hypothetical protein